MISQGGSSSKQHKNRQIPSSSMFNDIVIEPGQPARRKRQAPADSGPGPGPMFNQDTPELTEQV